jgi:hypothetical protein
MNPAIRTWLDPTIIDRKTILPESVPGDWGPLVTRLHSQWGHLVPGIRLASHRVPPSTVTNYDNQGAWWMLTTEHPLVEDFRPRKVWNGKALEREPFTLELQRKAMSFYSFFAPSYVLVSFEQCNDVWVQCLVRVRR